MNQAGHVYAQENSAKILGFQRLFKFHHTPSQCEFQQSNHFFRITMGWKSLTAALNLEAQNNF